MCKNDCNCISEILQVICLLQKNAYAFDDTIESCSKPTLGQLTTTFFNTRPVMLYTCISNGETPWSAPTTREVTPEATSTVFRVERINGCCATFRVLIANDDGTYTSTQSFFTMNLECVCCIRCLGDTFVENI